MKQAHKQYDNESDIEYAIRLGMIESLDREIKQADLAIKLYTWVVLPLVIGLVTMAMIWMF
jgi:ABC-type uncharacterized transport system involved in gliding motility auxiliary subunit